MQIVRNQIIDLIINEGKIDNGAVAYAKLKSADIETSLSGGASKLATAAAIKTYVDAQIPDAFSGGNGIDIDASGDPDVISVDLATNPGLQFTSAKLDLKLKSESGGSLTKDSNGLYIADSAISNAKLANSTISGVALGANLASLSAGDGISMTGYNGAAAVNDLTVQLDGGTLAKSGSGVKVADAGIDTDQLANNAATAAKVSFAPQMDSLTTNGSTTAFNLTTVIPSGWEVIDVYRNGLRIEQKESSPSGVDEFIVATSGGTSTVTFGAAPASSDKVVVRYWG
tara:strand:- start:1143 stop:1997 length:855 start_codon:yes stop_codon:yes gene_type:complete